MRWGSIKTLFIICFLILDIYLVLEIVDKRQSEDLSTLEDTPRIDTLRANFEGFEMLENLSEEEMQASYLSLQPRKFTAEDLQELESAGNQNSTAVSEGNILISEYEEPVAVPSEATNAEMETMIEETAVFADNYTFWEKEDNTNTLIFFQEIADRPLYYSQSALLLVFLNEENEMTHYIQTEMEEDEDWEGEQRSLIQPVDALTYLDNNADDLLFGDEITDAELGHQTLVPLQESQVYVPSWRIEFNNDKNYLVNAVEGGFQKRDNLSFLRETLTSYNEILSGMEETNETAEEMKIKIQTILETTTWSEENDN